MKQTFAAAGGGESMSDSDVLRLSKECLGDKSFMDRFKRAMGDEEIPDPAKDQAGHMAFIKKMQERLAEEAMAEQSRAGKVFEDKDGQWTFTLPEPVFCIKATDESGRKKVFINICKSPAIAEPMPMTKEESQDSGISDDQLQFRVPISIGPVRADKDKSGKPAMVFDIAVNPITIGKCEANPEFKRLVCALCLYGLKQKHVTDLNTDEYKTPNLKVKGKPVVQRVRLQKKKANVFDNEIALPGDQKAKEPGAKAKIEVVGEEKAPAAPSVEKPGSGSDALWDTYQGAAKDYEKELEEEYKEMRKDNPQLPPLPPKEGEAAEEAAAAATRAADVTPETAAKRRIDVSQDGQYDWSAHKHPARNSYWQARADVPARITVTAHLPEVQATVRECSVDVTQKGLKICGVDDEEQKSPYVDVEFRFPVDADSAKAKFVKKKHLLTLTVTVRLPDEDVQQRQRRDATQREDDAEKAAAKAKEDADEKRYQENVARRERMEKEDKECRDHNKELVEAAKSMQEGSLPAELKKMVDDLPPEEARQLMARLQDGKARGDNVDEMLEKLPKVAIDNMIDTIRDRLGLEKRPERVEQERRKKEAEERMRKEKEAEDDPDNFGFGGDRAAEKLFGFKFRNRYTFGLDM